MVVELLETLGAIFSTVVNLEAIPNETISCFLITNDPSAYLQSKCPSSLGISMKKPFIRSTTPACIYKALFEGSSKFLYEEAPLISTPIPQNPATRSALDNGERRESTESRSPKTIGSGEETSLRTARQYFPEPIHDDAEREQEKTPVSRKESKLKSAPKSSEITTTDAIQIADNNLLPTRQRVPFAKCYQKGYSCSDSEAPNITNYSESGKVDLLSPSLSKKRTRETDTHDSPLNCPIPDHPSGKKFRKSFTKSTSPSVVAVIKTAPIAPQLSLQAKSILEKMDFELEGNGEDSNAKQKKKSAEKIFFSSTIAAKRRKKVINNLLT